MGLALDQQQRLWVLCRGLGAGDAGQLARVNLTTQAVELRVVLDSLQALGRFGTWQLPDNLVVSPAGDLLYFTLGSEVFRFPVNGTRASAASSVIANRGRIARLGLDPLTGFLFVAAAVKANAPAFVARYRAPAIALADSFRVLAPVVDFAFAPRGR